MLRFLTRGDAAFSYAVDFETAPYANLSFFAANKRDILFHLSLRREKGLAVTNSKRNGTWTGENPRKAGFRRDAPQDVAITFAENTLMVVLNGETLFQSDGEFGDLDKIEHVNWGGAVLDDSIAVAGTANEQRTGLGRLRLGGQFSVTGWAFDPASPRQEIGLEIAGLTDQPRVHVRAAAARAAELQAPTDLLALRADLPGRIWTAAEEDGLVRLQATSNGIPCGDVLEIGRPDILDMIGKAAASAPEADSFLALSVIEHVRFAGLFDALSDRARTYVLAAAHLYNAMNFLFPDGLPAEAHAAPARPEAPATATSVLAQRLHDSLETALAEDPGADLVATLDRLFETFPLEDHVRLEVVMSLVGSACRDGQPETLAGLNTLISDQVITATGPASQIMVKLPFLMLREDLATVAGAVRILAESDHAWGNPSALGWCLHWLARSDTNPWEDRHFDTVMRGLMQVVERLTRSYWRMPCRTLTTAAVELLLHADRLPGAASRHIDAFCIACFSLSHAFWRQVRAACADGRLTLSPALQGAAAAYDRLAAAETGDPAGIDRGLRFLEARGAIEAPRWRLELLGPGGCGPGAQEDAVLRLGGDTGHAPGELALRSLAFPGGDAGDPLLAGLARDRLRRRWNNVEKAPYYEVQRLAGRRVRAVIDGLAGGAGRDEISAQVAALLPHLRKISGQASGFLGLDLKILLIDRLIRQGHLFDADRVLGQIGQVLRDMPETMRDRVAHTPNVQSTLAALARLPDLDRQPTALAVLELFADGVAPDAPNPAAPVPAWESASPLFNTLVTVFSCKPYLDSRVPAIRDGWLRDLEALGIPYVVVVGDGDGRLEGDVLHLAAPDDYEGLPHKTLAAVDWVFNTTGFAHMLKIDDDCYLNVDEFFHSLSYRKFDYYGRQLTRNLGDMNRSWHHEKSRSARARLELDKSPEPASYADGGGGYTLSRNAMRALLSARDSREGWRLIDSSYMEDKMVGDLLSLREISVASEDYYTTIWRRSHGAAQPVMLWDNYFLPSAASPCKMAHLDTAEAQAPTHAHRAANRLFPRKLWPSFTQAGLGFDSNQLELVSDEAELARLNAAELAVICVCRNEVQRLPAFLAHYRKLGVGCFLFVDNLSDDGTREFLLEQKDCAVFSADTNYPVGRFGVTWQVTLMSNLRLHRWSLIADTDELLVFPGWEKGKLDAFVREATTSGADAFRAFVVDMYPDGPLSRADLSQGDPFAIAGFTDRSPLRPHPLFHGPFGNDTTWTSAVRHRLVPDSRSLTFLAQKYPLLRYNPAMRLANGLHFAADLTVAEQELILAHFKYDAGFAARARSEAQRGKHFNGAEEYHRYVGICADDPDPVFHDTAVSVPWREADVVKRVLG